MKKFELKLKDFLSKSQQVQNTKAIKGGTGSEEDPDTEDIVGVDDIIDL